jgi:putative ABC transport system permease protein
LSLSTANRLGFNRPEEAIGQDIYVFKENKATVIGVFEDYKLEPLLNEGFVIYRGNPGLALTYKEFLLPGALFNKPNRMSLRVQPETFNDAIVEIEKKYQKHFADGVFNWYFLDSVIDGKYKQQLVARNQITLFSILAIGIACLGLLGIISNKALEKTKEIGIRKVLGAELHQIAQMLLSTTTKQIVIATVISIPLTYYVTQQYLQNFSEHIHLRWWHYLLPLVILIGIMLGSVATVVWKAAKQNPVDALKYE